MADQDRKKLTMLRDASPAIQSLISKMVPDTAAGEKGAGKAEIDLPKNALDKLSKSVAQDRIDTEYTYQVLPDVELAEEILKGAILSPNDMVGTSLDYKSESNKFDPTISRALIAVIEDYFKRIYKLDEEAEERISEGMFTSGAHIIAIIPENALDAIISQAGNKVTASGYEQIIGNSRNSTSMGILGTNGKLKIASGNEHFVHEPTTDDKKPPVTLRDVIVSDDFNELKVLGYRRLKRGKVLSTRISAALEAYGKKVKGFTPKQIEELYEANSDTTAKDKGAVFINPQYTMSRPSLGHPLRIKLPVESCIPAYVPGAPEEHIGYFVLLDEKTGNPLKHHTDIDYFSEMRSQNTRYGADPSSEILAKVRRAVAGEDRNAGNRDLEQLSRAYGTVLETDFQNRLISGIYDDEAEVSIDDNIARMMLSRAFRRDGTRVIYVPAELVVYSAFEYDENGIGSSILSRTKILSGMRSVLLFADTMSGIRNAIGRKRVEVTIDGADPDPMSTFTSIQNLILELARNEYPIWNSGPNQTVSSLQRAGYDFSVNIDSEKFPDTKVSFDDYNTQVSAGNEELSQRLLRMHAASYGLTPELLDPTQSPEFATSIVNNSLMLVRRVIREQKKLNGFNTKTVKLFTKYSSILRKELLDVVEAQKKLLTAEQKKLDQDALIDEFIESVVVSLPSPDTTKIEAQQQMFSAYRSLLEECLEAYITRDMFTPEQLALDSDIVEQVRAAVMAFYLRQWMQRNNVLPELDQLTEMDDNGKAEFNLLDIQDGHMSTLGEAIQAYVDKLFKQRAKWEKKQVKRQEKLDAAAAEAEGGGDDSPVGGDDQPGYDDYSGDNMDDLTDNPTSDGSDGEDGGDGDDVFDEEPEAEEDTDTPEEAEEGEEESPEEDEQEGGEEEDDLDSTFDDLPDDKK